jgi:hypothetical protein
LRQQRKPTYKKTTLIKDPLYTLLDNGGCHRPMVALVLGATATAYNNQPQDQQMVDSATGGGGCVFGGQWDGMPG